VSATDALARASYISSLSRVDRPGRLALSAGDHPLNQAGGSGVDTGKPTTTWIVIGDPTGYIGTTRSFAVTAGNSPKDDATVFGEAGESTGSNHRAFHTAPGNGLNKPSLSPEPEQDRFPTILLAVSPYLFACLVLLSCLGARMTTVDEIDLPQRD
jgi:hypothetical protein